MKISKRCHLPYKTKIRNTYYSNLQSKQLITLKSLHCYNALFLILFFSTIHRLATVLHLLTFHDTFCLSSNCVPEYVSLCTNCLCSLKWMCSFYIQFNNLQNLFIYDKITTKKYSILIMLYIIPIINGLKWNTSNNYCSSETIIPSFYTSQVSTDQPLCFNSLIVASYQSVANVNIIMKFLIGHKSLCLTVLLSLSL